MYNDLIFELSTNFIEYAAAVNSDRAIPNATDGLKPVAKRIIYSAFDKGFKSNKPHVKNANIVGNVMGEWHPHGDSSIYGALVRLSQPWVMRYPLIDFHGSNGNIHGDGPAAYRYTEGRLAKITEDGMLFGIKKNNVDTTLNYDETKQEPIELPAIFPNLLCNPNSGIGVALACNWAPHNLREVGQAIHDYVEGREVMLPGPDFPTGGIIINGKDLPNIVKTGHGSVKIRGRYIIENNNIIFTEIPYGVNTESLMSQIGDLCDKEEIKGIKNIRNESNKKGFRLVIECEKSVNPEAVVAKLFEKSDLQSSFSYNQVALVNKTPTELGLDDCIKIYLDFNSKCITKEVKFDINKAEKRIHIILGLIKAIDIINEIIIMIKSSSSSKAAKETLINRWGFTEEQAKAILDIKLARLAKLERDELVEEKTELEKLLVHLKEILANPIPELLRRLDEIVAAYGDDRRTEITHIEITKAEKEKPIIEEKEVVVCLTQNGKIYRVDKNKYKPQGRTTKGTTMKNPVAQTVSIKTTEQIALFSSIGKGYRILVDDIQEKETSLVEYINLEKDEIIKIMSKCDSTDSITFITKKGYIKKLKISDLGSTEKKNRNGAKCLGLNDEDSVISLINAANGQIILFTKSGKAIKFSIDNITETGKTAKGVISIKLDIDDEVVSAELTSCEKENVLILTRDGYVYKTSINEFPLQNRNGKGIMASKKDIAGSVLVNENDQCLITGSNSTKVIKASDFPLQKRNSVGLIAIKGNTEIYSIARL